MTTTLTSSTVTSDGAKVDRRVTTKISERNPCLDVRSANSWLIVSIASADDAVGPAVSERQRKEKMRIVVGTYS